MTEITEEQIQKYKLAFENQKAWCKKYHMTEKGKERRRAAQKKYYNKKKLEKLNSIS